MQTLIERELVLVTECPVGLRILSLKLLLALATATDNVSQNTILEYLMMNSIFESIIHSANPYIVKLSILDDELALNGLGQVVSNILSDFNREFAMRQPDQQQQGFFSTITSMVGGMLLAEENGNGGQSHLVRANHGILLALYEAVHLNRNFVTALTHSHTIMETSPPHSPVALNPPLDLSAESQSSNLLVTFLQYSSIVFQDVKDESKQCNAKLCLIIMTCIAEDQYANSLMHDANMNFRVQLHKMPMRHRKPKPEKAVPSRPLACALLDLMVEFVMSHMMKNLPMELYLKCLGITHRVLCYQKRCRVRLNYTWKELWTALISLLKFLLAQESSLLPQYNIFQLASQVVNIFNLFITYGDTFLPSPTSYDELYYEVVRMHQVFDNLYSMALRYTSTEGEYKEVASRLTNSLVNIRAIINHFNPKIDSWAAVNHLSALTEEQVLEVVRGNYDTLTLKLHDSLDLFERYSEKPKESSFFTQLVRSVIQDVRTHVATTAVTQERVLQEFSSIS
ncbi:PREDICTED: UPF0668 protein C10orf76 homolog [Priapulus caudatus]|uniref:UPF0668 protein C10orf76 homolog n=1 Tax=Priapulus caudatus TaxID=37621 RepID=A0ABM1DQF2_PRICU|nr:PREDICTED: UPF0668 protein C10orf76 homolog [Priapulus caudatus]